jgi:hypothetical protein
MKSTSVNSRRRFLKSVGAAGVIGPLQTARGQRAGEGFISEPVRQTKIVYNVDVVVVGGGTAGAVAALAAARTGASTVLIEKFGTVGGHPTVGRMSVIRTHWLNEEYRPTKGGFMVEILDRLCKAGGTPYPSMAVAFTGRGAYPSDMPIDPEKLSVVELDMLHEAGVKMMLHAVYCDPIMRGSAIEGVIVQTKSGRVAVRAKVVIDASGDADVAASAGASCIVAPLSSSGNSWGTLMRMGGVDLKRVFNTFLSLKNDPDPSDFVRWLENYSGKSADEIRRGTQCLRRLLPDDRNISNLENEQVWFKEVWEKNGFFAYLTLNHFWNYIRKAVDAGDLRLIYPIEGGGEMTINWDGLNAGVWGPDVALVHTIWPEGISGLDFEGITRVEIASRKRVYEMANFLKKYIEGFERSFVIDISYMAMDRGARAIDGEFSFTEQNWEQPKEDSIFVYGPPAYLKKVGPQFQAPYRMLLPRKVDNLLVAGMCASTGSRVRAIAGCMPMGHAAGTAAAMCAATGVKPRDLDYRELQAKLKAQGQIIDL